MDKILKYIEQSKYKEYYLKEFEILSEEDKSSLLNLVEKLDKAGAKEPLSWAFSEVKENIPQFGRFLVLHEMFRIINDPKGNLSMAEDMDGDISLAKKIIDDYGEKEFNTFLKAFTKGVMWSVATDIIDGTNERAFSDDASWAIFETNELSNKPRIIQGIHEEFYDFEEELKDENDEI